MVTHVNESITDNELFTNKKKMTTTTAINSKHKSCMCGDQKDISDDSRRGENLGRVKGNDNGTIK
jgi:hypothetical protein